MAFMRAIGNAFKAPAKALMNAPGMGAIRKPLQKGMQATPGLKSVGQGMGLGPSRAPQAPPPQAMQSAGNAVGNAFNPMMRGAGPMRPPAQQYPIAPLPPPEMIQGPPEGNDQAMMDMKRQQMEQQRPQMPDPSMRRPMMVGQGGGFGQMAQNYGRPQPQMMGRGIGPSFGQGPQQQFNNPAQQPQYGYGAPLNTRRQQPIPMSQEDQGGMEY